MKNKYSFQQFLRQIVIVIGILVLINSCKKENDTLNDTTTQKDFNFYKIGKEFRYLVDGSLPVPDFAIKKTVILASDGIIVLSCEEFSDVDDSTEARFFEQRYFLTADSFGIINIDSDLNIVKKTIIKRNAKIGDFYESQVDNDHYKYVVDSVGVKINTTEETYDCYRITAYFNNAIYSVIYFNPTVGIVKQIGPMLPELYKYELLTSYN